MGMASSRAPSAYGQVRLLDMRRSNQIQIALNKLKAEGVREALYAMLCYTMPCHAMPCYAILCYMLCYQTLLRLDERMIRHRHMYAIICHAMLCYPMPCHAMLCYAMLC